MTYSCLQCVFTLDFDPWAMVYYAHEWSSLVAYVIQKVAPRHHLIIQYAFNGLNNTQIAVKMGMSPVAVGCILRSPAAKAELQRLVRESTEKTTNIPARVALHHELTAGAVEGFRVNRALLRDPFVKPETRARIGQHLMDRVIFDKREDGSDDGTSYRDILRKLDKLTASIQPPTTIQESEPTHGGSPLEVNEQVHTPELSLVRGGKRIIDVSDND